MEWPRILTYSDLSLNIGVPFICYMTIGQGNIFSCNFQVVVCKMEEFAHGKLHEVSRMLLRT